jgi:hypothetical protein
VVTVNYKGSRFDSNVDIEWTDSTSSEPVDRDYNGRAIVTQVGEQVEGLTYELADPVVVIRRKFLLFNAYTITIPTRHKLRHVPWMASRNSKANRNIRKKSVQVEYAAGAVGRNSPDSVSHSLHGSDCRASLVQAMAT